MRYILTRSALALALALAYGCGESPAAPPGTDAGADAPPNDVNPSLSFFVTSEGNGAAGGDYGGIAGADARCQSLAEAVGAGGRTWRAYLSTADIGIGPVEDARDRIGTGPWFNAAEQLIANDLEGLHAAGIDPVLMMDETGAAIPRNEHDLLTGSSSDGRVTFRANGNNATCLNWTSGANPDYGWVGHTDISADDWSDSHESRCSQIGMQGVNGAGRIMCFAAD